MRRRLNQPGDDGLGMILVVAIVGIVTTLMLVAATTATRSLQSSRKHVSFESALSAAESGIDAGLARAQKAYESDGADTYAIPSPTDPTCAASKVAWPYTSEPSADTERQWAKTQLLALAATASCRTVTDGGTYVFMKPTGHQAVYAMGFSPSYGAAEMKTRLLKAEYLFTPYSPTNAILTGSDLEIDSSTTVTTAPPADPTVASVHANGNITIPNGNPTVYGTVSQTGTGTAASSNKFYNNTSGTVTTTVRQPVPGVSAHEVWKSKHSSNPPGGWYDLCADGSARLPDGSDVCTGTVVGTNSWRGWTFDGSGSVPRWLATSAIKQNGYSGTYYVNGGDAVASASNAGSPVPNMTVIAASQSTTCNKVGGNIDWDQIDFAAPSIANTFMIADQDLLTHSSFYAGSDVGGTVISGFFIAGDQIQLETSSNGAYGAVIAADECDPPNGQSLVDSNVVKNPSIYFDPNGQTPFIDTVNTTLWLEYGS